MNEDVATTVTYNRTWSTLDGQGALQVTATLPTMDEEGLRVAVNSVLAVVDEAIGKGSQALPPQDRPA